MAKSKAPTPQEIYRQRKQREEKERTAYLPPGLINHGNTCFMNSVLQGLIATRLLSDLMLFNEIPAEVQRTALTPIVSKRSPLLTNGSKYYAGKYAQPEENSMPIGDSFVYAMARAWNTQAARKREIPQSPRAVLNTLGQKYDQYLDFAQQDAHEFLRILLDAMRMEEFDVIKKRQPPPPNQHKKRRRTTITPSSSKNSQDPTQPNGLASQQEDLPLMSFPDMIFGGQLTSILVCQKCKHVSQTYEEFNDISLSIKAEDYLHNRKRDRFKKMVGRLTAFPGTSSKEGSSSSDKPSPTLVPLVPNHTIEILRSSSVPPSPRSEREVNVPGGGHEEPPLEPPRRRSLDVSVRSLAAGAEPGVEDSETTPTISGEQVPEKEDEGLVESDSSHVIVNVTGPDDKHVEFVEPKRERKESASDKGAKEELKETEKAKEKEKEKEKEKTLKQDDSWAKLGRRISLNIGLGRAKDKDKDKKDRERKSRSMDRNTLGAPIKEGVVADTPAMQKSHSAGAPSSSLETQPKSRVSSEGSIRATTEAPISLLSKPLPPRPPTQNSDRAPSPQPPSSHITSHISPAVPSLFPTVQRSKSPKPPKPSSAEAEYLRKILADVNAASSNPFAIFKPPLLHTHSSKSVIPTTSSDPTSAAAWLGMGVRPFSGIEECLRLFTAVEVLDGENMVGCRRCWKIANGVYTRKQDCAEDSDQEEEGEESNVKVPETSSMEAPVTGQLPEAELKQPRPILRVSPASVALSSSSSTRIPTSVSTPTISSYSHTSTTDDSLSSFPTSFSDANLTSSKDTTEDDGSDSPLSLSIASEGSTSTRTSGGESLQNGPGGLPIPVISTTAPVEPSESDSSVDSHYTSFSDSTGGGRSRGDTDRDAAYARLTGGEAPSKPSIPSPLPRLTQALYGYKPSTDSKDSLVIPQVPKSRYQKRRSFSDVTTDNDTSDESDTSIETSVSADSAASGSILPPNQLPNGTNGMSSDISRINPQAASVLQEMKDSKLPPQKKPSKPSKPKPVTMRPAYKRYLIATPPPVLVIHLKRFQQTSKTLMSFSHGFKKLDDYVSFPEYLDLTPFLAPKKEDYGLGRKGKEKRSEKAKEKRKGVSSDEERSMYRLYAVVVHIGNMLGGHYIAYTALPSEPPVHREASSASSASSADLNSTSNGQSSNPSSHVAPQGDASASGADPAHPVERQWAYISDTIVRLTTLEEVLNAKAYICMYERC